MGEESFAGVVSFDSWHSFFKGTVGQIFLLPALLFCFLSLIPSPALVEWAAVIVMTTSEGRGHWRTIGIAQLFFLWLLEAVS